MTIIIGLIVFVALAPIILRLVSPVIRTIVGALIAALYLFVLATIGFLAIYLVIIPLIQGTTP